MAELVSIKRNVDVSPGQAAPAVFHCSQGDVGSKIILGLLNNGTAYSIPSGVTVTIEGSESNGSIFTPISATVSGSDITFYLTGEMTAVAGPAICQAVLKSGSNILGTANFTLEVESSPMGADAPPVFTDAGWTWMLNKLNTEFVPALGNETIIDAIDSKADQSDLTALSNTVAGHTGSITVLNNTVNTLNHGVTENRQNIARKLDKNQGTANAGKYLKVQSTGQVVPVDLIDDSLLVETMAADAKATGVAISKKLNKYFGQAEAGKYLKVGTSGYVDSADLDVTTDKTLSITDKAADAKAVGDELTDLKADLNEVLNKFLIEKSESSSAYEQGMMRPDNGNRIASTTRIYCEKRYPGNSFDAVSVNEGYKYVIYAYSVPEAVTNTFIGYYYRGEWITSNPLKTDAWLTGQTVIPSSGYGYFLRIILAKSDDSTITKDDAVNIKVYTHEVVKNYLDFNAARIVKNRLCRDGISYIAVNTWDSVENFYLNGEDYSVFYTNARLCISEYTASPTGNDPADVLIKTTMYDNKGIVYIDSNTKYVRISFMNDVAVDRLLFIPVNSTVMDAICDLTHDYYKMPKTWGIANANASARQLANLEYTTLAPMPITGYTNGYVPAGTKLKGVPYSSTRSVCKYVGQHVSLYTFLSAINNPRSVLYTRRIEYGSLGKSYYGSTCFTYTSYATGSRLGYFDNELTHVYDLEYGGEYEEISPYDVEPGDCFILMTDREDNTRGGNHTLYIHDIYKDKEGRIKVLTVGQLKPPTAVIGAEPFAVNAAGLFQNHSQHYRAYKVGRRRDRKTGNIDYGTYDQYSFVQGYEDEIPTIPTYPDIMPEYGDKACIEAGEDVVINVIDATGYNTINVYKDDQLIDTRSQITDFTISDIAYGTYRFEMTGTDKTTESFLIVADVHATYNPDSKVITFSSANATPCFVTSYYVSGGSKGAQNFVKRFTLAEISAGQASVSDLVGTNCPAVQIGFLTEFGVAMWWSEKLTGEWAYWTPPTE